MRAALIAVLLGGLPAAGCTPASDCSALGPAMGLATGAAMVRIEVYPPPAQCQGSRVAAGGAVPLRTASFPPSAIGAIALPAGSVVVHLQAYRDAGETLLLGEGCSVAEIRAGESACLALPVIAVSSGGDGGTCTPVTHSNGVGQTYLDCAPVGAVDARLAEEACLAATGNAAQCATTINCSGGPGSGNALCAMGAHCTCWTYSGSRAGLVHVTDGGGGCACGVTGDAAWN